MQGFTNIDLAVLVIYLILVLLLGIHFAKKDMKGKEYFKGDGTIPWWVTSVSIFATLLSPISFLSLVGISFAGTWLMWFAQLGMILAIPLTIRYFLPIYSKLDIDTAYHYLELRFKSKMLRVLGAVMFIIYQIGRMSIIMYLPCMVLSTLTGLDVNLLIIVMGITVMNKGVSIDTYSAKHYDADYAAFGGDFYTEIYGVTDMIVDELNDINSGVEVLSESMATMASVIYYSTGMIIIALGLGVVAVSCNHIKKENA